MKTIFVVLAIATGALAITNPPITGPTPSPVSCPNSLCSGKADGNFKHPSADNYFVQCVAGTASCQACWPQSMKFSEKCNQCLYNLYDDCYTTQSWVPETRYSCPDMCPSKGADYQGNIADPTEGRHYIGCWNGITMGCVNCPKGLLFNEKENACLYEGKYLTQSL